MSTEDTDVNPPDPESPAAAPRASRRKPLTPELRRFLGQGRSWHDREADAAKEKEVEEEVFEPTPEPPISKPVPPPEWTPPPARPSAPKSERPRSMPVPAVVPDQRMSRVLEMQTAAIIVGLLILLGAAFYTGTKIRSLKAFVMSRSKPELQNVDVKKFPGLSADELVEQALAVERLGQWRDAVERLLVAKRRNPLYRGLVFHAGKICYEHGDFDAADRLLGRAITYGEQVDTANYLRGLIAVGRNDLPAAEQFFEAAILAEPFTPGYYYYLGEALRREHRSKEAITRYEQAAARSANEPDAVLCRFKARMAKAETTDNLQLQSEIDKKRAEGALTVDWLLTDAALKIRFGQIAEGAQLVQQARASDQGGLSTLFASCTSDVLFTDAAAKHTEIAEACRVAGPSAPRSPAPLSDR